MLLGSAFLSFGEGLLRHAELAPKHYKITKGIMQTVGLNMHMDSEHD